MKIHLQDETAELIAWHANASGLSASDLVGKLLGAHMAEMWELRTFMEESATYGTEWEQAINLLLSYGGGESIMQGIAHIDPRYQTLQARFAQSLRSNHRLPTS
jgi:hypothetical protein